MTAADSIPALLERTWKDEAGRLVGATLRIVRDLSLAEEIAQEALVAAMERWPVTGVPANPAAWLMTTARHRAIDQVRRQRRSPRATTPDDEVEAMAQEPPERHSVDDDRLRLVFACCHPALPQPTQVALTLRMVAGLSTAEIARGFLVPEATMAQRLVRAKRLAASKKLELELPVPGQLEARLSVVLEVIYLVFNEGFTAQEGEQLHRAELCNEALRLGGILLESFPANAELLGLMALMELQFSRHAARTDGEGELVLLEHQDRTRWNLELIGRGFVHLSRATQAGPPERYQLQAHIAACHARAPRWEDTDFASIAALYERLMELWPSPVVALNRAIAVGLAHGPADGLRLIDRIRRSPKLRHYALLPAARADVLRRLGRLREAKTEYRQALKLTRNGRERAFLERRIAECDRALD